PARFALRASRILTLDDERSPVVDDGLLLVEAGRIVAVGARGEIELAGDVPLLDLGERIVVPGFVDLHHHVSSGGGDLNDMVAAINVELRTLDTIRPSARAIAETVAGGVTTTLFIPGSGTNISGFGAILKMIPNAPLDEMVVRELGAMKVAQGYNPERRSGDLGETRMGMHAQLTH